jgi:cytochrome c oxidase cbb3-type subunit 3
MSDFIGEFWNIYITFIVIVSLIWLGYVLLSQATIKLPRKEEIKVTGHIWDEDLEEYNHPLPSWWMWLYMLTLIFAVVYLTLYPGLGSFKGLFGWTSDKQYVIDVSVTDKKYAPLYQTYLQLDIPTLAKNKEANAMGRRLFLTYCMQCHGSDARGAKGFPNLTDHDWLYGGTPKDIQQTIAEGRHGQMAAWGAAFGEEKIKDVAHYVLKIAKRSYNEARATRGAIIFQQACVTCHGKNGTGNHTLGAPNLTDKTWLYGGSEAAIIETITNGRDNQMPAWKDFLGEGKVHLLSAYVYSLSHK